MVTPLTVHAEQQRKAKTLFYSTTFLFFSNPLHHRIAKTAQFHRILIMVELPGSPDGPLVALAFKLENYFGQLTCLRIYEGVIRTGGFIINVNTGKKSKVHFLVQMHSNAMIGFMEIEEAHAGQIVVVNGLDCASGDAFTDGSVRYTITSKKIPEPVMSLAVQPVSKDSGEQVVF